LVLPKSDTVAGTRTIRTRVASTKIAVARPKPSTFRDGTGLAAHTPAPHEDRDQHPYATPIDNTFIAAAFSRTRIDRKTSISSWNEIASTVPMNSGRVWLSWVLKSSGRPRP
jgi:hypothetical protein